MPRIGDHDRNSRWVPNLPVGREADRVHPANPCRVGAAAIGGCFIHRTVKRLGPPIAGGLLDGEVGLVQIDAICAALKQSAVSASRMATDADVSPGSRLQDAVLKADLIVHA